MPFNYKYQYYDTPEGKDIAMKSFALSRYAVAAGLGMGTYDVLLYSRPQGILNSAGRFIYYTGPLVGMAVAFTVTTNAAQNFRGKNDYINYFMGGAMAGAVFGAWQKSLFVGIPVALILGFGAMAKKNSIDNKWEFFPKLIQSTKDATSARNDFTLMPELPKSWK